MKIKPRTQISFWIGLYALSVALTMQATGHARELPSIEDMQRIEQEAKEGSPEAIFDLARARFRGIGGEPSPEEAVELLKKAAGQGYAPAFEVLGFFYNQGIGVEKNESLSVQNFRTAAKAGLPVAQLNLGLMLRAGKGADADHEDGLRWMGKAAESGLAEARYALGELYFLGDDDQPKDREKAIPLLLPLAESGNPKAQNLLGIAARDGLGGMSPNPEEAEIWFRKAALQGDPKAQSNLGHLLGEPLPTNPHHREALKWLLLSEDQGEITAKKTLSELRPQIGTALMLDVRQEADKFYQTKATNDSGATNMENAEKHEVESREN